MNTRKVKAFSEGFQHPLDAPPASSMDIRTEYSKLKDFIRDEKIK